MACGWPVGSALVGLLIRKWSIPGQYLIQISSFILGMSLILSTILKDHVSHIFFSIIYGMGIGSWNYSLRYHSYKTVGCKLSEVSWSYQVFAQSLPTLLGSPAVFFTNENLGTSYGFIIGGCSALLGCLIIFSWAFVAKHQTNQEVLREAHLKTKIFQEDSLSAMKVSDEFNYRLNKENLAPNSWSKEERVQEFVLQTSNNSLPLPECLSTAV
ncbi:unnamed protein product [Dimorphilus gyrociliatus]|uniref:Uncharacterized protein n=1 Tax=Dimorphilus gyrociliatus TaxID=2664684 RepID=A0A7I8V597_9ANNE|nr:unnamed protein product [Dimorphilus gyrociliatus]